MRAAGRPRPVGVQSAESTAPLPVSLSVPAIGVTTPLEHLDVRDDGTLAPPASYEQAGWFAAGPAPGQRGPAVIAGHVDSRRGAAVFYRLGDLRPGDVADVGREDGTTVRFRVTDVREYPKDRFPTEQVYGPAAGAALRLITCSGVFDEDSGHYRSNLVVYAELA
ncbi:MAG: class F sortase [Acidimicrobiales bacterium]